MSSPILNKDKHYLPSRYALDSNKKDSNMLTLLNCTHHITQLSNLTPVKNLNSKFLHPSSPSPKTAPEFKSTRKKKLQNSSPNLWKENKATSKTSNKFSSIRGRIFSPKFNRKQTANKSSWRNKSVKTMKNCYNLKKDQLQTHPPRTNRKHTTSKKLVLTSNKPSSS